MSKPKTCADGQRDMLKKVTGKYEEIGRWGFNDWLFVLKIELRDQREKDINA